MSQKSLSQAGVLLFRIPPHQFHCLPSSPVSLPTSLPLAEQELLTPTYDLNPSFALRSTMLGNNQEDYDMWDISTLFETVMTLKWVCLPDLQQALICSLCVNDSASLVYVAKYITCTLIVLQTITHVMGTQLHWAVMLWIGKNRERMGTCFKRIKSIRAA